jgi:hypothetical protein
VHTVLPPHRTLGRVASAAGALCLHASLIAALVWLGTRPLARTDAIFPEAGTPIAVLLPQPPGGHAGRDAAPRSPSLTVPSPPPVVPTALPPPPLPPPPPGPTAVAEAALPTDSGHPASGDTPAGPGLGPGAPGSGTSPAGDYISVASPRAAILPPLGQVPGAVAGRTYHIRFWVAADGRVTRVAIDPPMPDDGYRRDLLERLLAYQFYPARMRSGTAVASVVTVPLRIGN